MRIVRFRAGGAPRAGVRDDEGLVVSLETELAGLLARPASEIRQICESARGERMISEIGELANPVVRGKSAVTAAGAFRYPGYNGTGV
jgi:hypothetical protein